MEIFLNRGVGLMYEFLILIYCANAVLLIVHEIDSAYWHEWELFKMPGGVSGFLLLHIPLVAVMLYGLVKLRDESMAGLAISLIMSLGGLFALCIHGYYLRKGRNEFRTPISLFILGCTGGFSFVQLVVTVIALVNG